MPDPSPLHSIEKDISETLKLKEIDQLHAAILEFSKNTLATKKICASLLVGVVAVILKLTNNKLDPAIYIGAFITILIFWIIDSYSYYYQKKLRIRMTDIVNELNKNGIVRNGYGMPLIRSENISWRSALFNSSQMFYFFGTIVIIVVAIINGLGWIGK